MNSTPVQYPSIPMPSAPMPPHNQPVSNGAVSYNSLSSAEERMQKFAQLAARYEINQNFGARLRQLEGYEIIFLCDDSGSMATPVGEINRTSHSSHSIFSLGIGDASNAFGVRSTRWDELKQIVSITVDIGSVLDPDGLDIHFLNRAALHNIKDSSQLVGAFANPPNGLTPITSVLRRILQERQSQIQERKLLIIIATDGQPTDDYGTTDIEALERVLKHERKPADRILVTFCACTDDDQAVGYLNKWDEKIPFVDVCDDYRSERDEIRRVMNAVLISIEIQLFLFFL